MKFKIFLLLLLISSSIFAKKVINSGHQSQVKFIEYHKEIDSFFSLSEDGTLVIKKRNSDKVNQRFFISGNTITSMALSPNNSYIAIVETNSAVEYSVSVWDWKRERRIYTIYSEELPMRVGFTGKGTYIYMTTISDQPIKFYNARSGAVTTFLKNNESYIDFVYVGEKESSATLYSSAGYLYIWDLKKSKLIKTIPAPRDLTNIMMSPDKNFLLGRQGDSIHIIQKNGKISDTIKEKDLSFYRLNETTSEIMIYINQRYKKAIKTVTVAGNKFITPEFNEKVIKGNIINLAGAYNSIVYSDLKGNVNLYNRWSNNTKIFADNNITNIEGIAVIGSTAILTSDDKLYLYKSDFFSDRVKNIQKLKNYELTQIESPLKNPLGILGYEDNLILWKESLILFNLENEEILLDIPFTSPIIDLKIQREKIIALDKNGLLKIIDLSTKVVEFEFKTPGFSSIAYINDNEIIGGYDSAFGGSLMSLDINTHETLPYQTSMDTVIDIMIGKEENIYYLVGINNKKKETSLIEYNIKSGKERRLAKVNSEELDSSYFFDNNKTIYTNLGTSSLLKIDSKTYRIKNFFKTIINTDKIYFNNYGLYTVNEDKSLSIWHPTTGRKLVDFYLFKDNNWVVITQNGYRAFGSPGSENFIGDN